MSPETVARLRAMGIEVDEGYDLLASSLQKQRDKLAKKELTIKHLSTTEENEVYTVKLEITSKDITAKHATVLLGVAESNTLGIPGSNGQMDGFSKQIALQSTTTVTFIINNAFNNYQDASFIATLTCDGITARTESFKLKVETRKDKSKKCYCNRDFTAEELREIVIYLRKNELVSKEGKIIRDEKGNKVYQDSLGDIPNGKDGKPIRKGKLKPKEDFMQFDYPYMKDNIFYVDQDEQLASNEANYELFAKEINKSFRNYKVNNCLQKIHFLAQAYTETQRFTKTYETTPNIANISGGEFYRGRGFLQLTHDYNYKEFYKIGSRGKEPTENELKEFVPKVAKSMKLACQGAGWYWDKIKINDYADNDDVEKVSAAINLPAALLNKEKIKAINALDERILYTSYFKLAMDYENCKKK